MKNSTTKTCLTVLSVLITMLCAIFIVSETTSQYGGIDCTDDNIYTLSEGSENIIGKINEGLTFSLFYSKSAVNKRNEDYFARFNTYYSYVKGLLKNYERLGDNKIIFNEYDPKPFTDAEELADDYNIQRLNISEKESFYFGIAVTSESGKRETIGFLNPDDQALLEYKVSELIVNATNREKNKLGVLSSLNVIAEDMGPYMRQMMARQGRQAPQSWAAIEEVKKYYDVSSIDNTTDKIEGIDLLLIIHPKELPDKTLYAIDQYIMSGKSAIIFVDPLCYIGDQAPQDPQNPYAAMGHKRGSNINKLIKKWGLILKEGESFAGDLNLILEQQPLIALQKYQKVAGCFNDKEIVSSNLNDIDTFFPGVLEKSEVTDVNVVPLITTSAEGNSWSPSNPYELQQINPETLRRHFIPGSEKVWVAAKITGKLSSAFPEGFTDNSIETDETNPTPPKKGLTQSEVNNTVIVVADVDILTDGLGYAQTIFGRSPRNKNTAFLLNCLQFMSGSTDLITVRSKGKFNRPFTKIVEAKKEAEKDVKDKVDQINLKIQNFQGELSKLQNSANENNVKLLQNEAIKKRREVEINIRQQKRELRKIQEISVAEEEKLGAQFRNTTQFYIPGILLVLGIIQAFTRYSKRQSDIQRRSE